MCAYGSQWTSYQGHFSPSTICIERLNKGPWASWKVSFPAEISPLSLWLLFLTWIFICLLSFETVSILDNSSLSGIMG